MVFNLSSSSSLSSYLTLEDPINPFFLHYGDSPKTLLVSQLLTGENYHTWSRSKGIGSSLIEMK
jgi:hypothetical protein